MSTVANLDINLRANLSALDKGFASARKTVEAFESAASKSAAVTAKDRDRTYADMLRREEAVHAQSYAGYKERLKKEEAARKEATKAADAAAKDAAKQKTADAAKSQAMMATAAATMGSMVTTATSAIASGSAKSILSGVGGIATTAATMVGGPIAGAVVGAVSAAASAAYDVVEAIGGRVASAIAGLAELSVGARTIGTTTRELAALQYAGSVAGVGIGATAGAMQSFATTMNQAARGIGPGIEGLRLLNLYGRQFIDLPLAEQMEAVLVRISEKGNAADKIDLAGRFGLTALIPLIQEGKTGIDQLKAKAASLGVGDPAGAKAAREATRAWRELQEAASAMWNRLASAVAPMVRDAVSWIVPWAEKFVKRFGDVGAMLSHVGDVARRAWAMMGDGGDSLLKLLSPGYAFLSMLSDMVGGWEGFRVKTIIALSAVEAAMTMFPTLLGVALDTGSLYVIRFGNTAVQLFTVTIPESVRAMADVVRGAFAGLSAAWDKLKSGDVRGAGRAFNDAWGRAADAARSRMRDALKVPKSEIEIALEARIKTGTDAFAEMTRKIAMERLAGKVGEKDEEAEVGERLVVGMRKAASMEYGSKESFSTIYGQPDRQQQALNTARAMLEEQRAAKIVLERILRENEDAPRLRRGMF